MKYGQRNRGSETRGMAFQVAFFTAKRLPKIAQGQIHERSELSATLEGMYYLTQEAI